jgi:hypothetical protein
VCSCTVQGRNAVQTSPCSSWFWATSQAAEGCCAVVMNYLPMSCISAFYSVYTTVVQHARANPVLLRQSGPQPSDGCQPWQGICQAQQAVEGFSDIIRLAKKQHGAHYALVMPC